MHDAKNTDTNSPAVPEKGAPAENDPRSTPPEGGGSTNQLLEDAEELEANLDKDLGDEDPDDDT